MELEYGELSSLRARRKVLALPETEPDEHSLKVALLAAEKLCSKFDPDPKLADPKFYTAGSLEVVLFERRAKAAANINSILKKMYDKLVPETVSCARRMDPATGKMVRKRRNMLQATLKDQQRIITESDGPLITRATRLIARQHEDRPNLGTEISLVLGEGYAPQVLKAQSETIYSQAQATKGYGKFPKGVHNPSRSNEVAILHFPFRSEAEADEFIDMFVPLPVVGLVLAEGVKFNMEIPPAPLPEDFGDLE